MQKVVFSGSDSARINYISNMLGDGPSRLSAPSTMPVNGSLYLAFKILDLSEFVCKEIFFSIIFTILPR